MWVWVGPIGGGPTEGTEEDKEDTPKADADAVADRDADVDADADGSSHSRAPA